MIRIGASGWSYKEWISVFYPRGTEAKDMLSFYARFFDTVEVNSSFYSVPKKDMVWQWARKTPKEFIFAVKVYQGITHDKKLRNVKKDLLDFLERLEPLNRLGKLGPLLIQLPPRFKRKFLEFENFLSFLSSLTGKLGCKFAVEFRHRSWIVDSVFKLLERYGVAYVIVDEPLLPPIVRVTTDIAYIRWHGRGEKIWYDYKYSRRELEKWVPKIKEVEASAEIVYGYFNNHFHGNAIKDALVMKELLGLSRVSEGIKDFLY